MKRTLLFTVILAASLHAAEPEVAPKYKYGAASDRQLAGDNWWRTFGDERLARLLDRVASENLDAQAALSRVEQARAVSGLARAEFFPSITLNPGIQRARNSGTQLVAGFSGPLSSATLTTTAVPLDFGYELDVWGRIRRNVEAAGADFEATRAAHASLVLTLRAEVAATWFALRTLDTQRGILRDTVELRRQTLQLARDKMNAGIGTDFDVARAEAEIATAEADLAGLAQRRPAFESSLAVLTGVNPSKFSLPADLSWGGGPRVPAVPAGIPAQLISRRPDVASAERTLAAASARIGVARAAFLPTVTLGGQIGLLTGDHEQTFDQDSRTWSFGAKVSLPVFDGGRNRFTLRAARATAAEARAKYEQSVLAATGDVETALGAIRALQTRREAQQRAVASTARGASLARDRYKAGTSPFLDVLEAERSALGARLASASLDGERLAITVQLIKALGGGWKTDAQ